MSAVARIDVGQIPDVLIVPTQGRSSPMAAGPSSIASPAATSCAVPIEIVRRGREQAAVKGRSKAGDRIALVSPVADTKGAAEVMRRLIVAAIVGVAVAGRGRLRRLSLPSVRSTDRLRSGARRARRRE